MYKKLRIVKLDYRYCDYLRKYDGKVPYNNGSKELRPFIGVLFSVGACEYFAPLASPKPKHKVLKNTLDIIKINKGIWGVINFNNMIPVASYNYEELDLNPKTNSKTERFRLELLQNQLRWLNSHRKEIYLKSRTLYNLFKENKLPKNVRDRCCNFVLLEVKSEEYNSINYVVN